MPLRILFIDAYDSFSNSIIALLQEALSTFQRPACVEKIYIDDPKFYGRPEDNYQAFRSFLTGFNAVVAGPGPGHPDELRDVGLMRVLWTLENDDLLPVLGICLGFQSMCSAAGANVTRLQRPRHGIITELVHSGRSVFSHVGVVKATHYHSLHVDIGHRIQGSLGLKASADLWKPSSSCPSIVPLAWDLSHVAEQGILMAAGIEGKPFCGVQYHPESICSSKEEAKTLMQNWWKECTAWSRTHRVRNAPVERGVKTALQPLSQSSSTSSVDLPRQISEIGQDNSSDRERIVGADQPDDVAMIGAGVENMYVVSVGSTTVQPDEAPLDHSTPNGGSAPLLDLTKPSSFVFDASANEFNHSADDCAWEGEDDRAYDPPDEDDAEFSNDESDEEEMMAPERTAPVRYGAFDFSTRVCSVKSQIEAAVRKRIVRHVRDVLDPAADEFVVLESGQSGRKQDTGRYSIIGLVDQNTIKICYYISGRRIEVLRGTKVIHRESNVDFATYWKGLKSSFKVEGGDQSVPFWGGAFLCYSYEASLETIGVASDKHANRNDRDRPDTVGVILLRSVVIDHHFHELWIQSIAPNDRRWVKSARRTLNRQLSEFVALGPHYEEMQLDDELDLEDEVLHEATQACSSNMVTHAVGPSKQDYEAAVRLCQEDIARGDSYELCLTGQTTIKLPLSRVPHRRKHRDRLLYSGLRARNPAPFGAHIQLHLFHDKLTIISSSPERFLSWDRRTKCQFRPIKGTLRKQQGMTMSFAEEYFKSTKERAENLMITDLIRHDLYGALKHPQSVRVPHLFRVEEYETVYQMVSVIEGRFQNTEKTGFDVLSASLPPGSMTGAPKKRSCELLQQHEGHVPRGMYSGVIGYDDVGGGGDFSVLIRAAVRWASDSIYDGSQNSTTHSGYEVWKIGAGGAVTSQSSAEDEYAEMVTKRAVVLGVFEELRGRYFPTAFANLGNAPVSQPAVSSQCSHPR